MKVQVDRQSEPFASLRKVRVVVDGRLAARLSNDERIELDLADGPHTLEVRLDWARSPRVNLDGSSGGLFLVSFGDPNDLWRRLLLHPRSSIALEPSSEAPLAPAHRVRPTANYRGLALSLVLTVGASVGVYWLSHWLATVVLIIGAAISRRVHLREWRQGEQKRAAPSEPSS